MTADIVQHALSDLDRGGASAFVTAGWDWWNRTGGNLSRYDDNLELLLPRLQLCVVVRPQDPPPMLYVGAESTSAHVFGAEWAAHVVGAPGIPDAAFEYAVNDVYARVLRTQEPEFHTVSAIIAPPHCAPAWVRYRRLVVPCHLRTGPSVMACFTEFTSAAASPDTASLHGTPMSANRLH